MKFNLYICTIINYYMSFNQFQNQTSNILFVADLPKETTYEDLSILFQPYHFQYASLNNSKASSVWAKVCLETESYAIRAKHELNGEILIPKLVMGSSKGKPIRICTFEGCERAEHRSSTPLCLLVARPSDKLELRLSR